MPEIIRALPLLEQMIQYGEKNAVVDDNKVISYRDLISLSAHIASGLLDYRKEKVQQRVGILLQPSVDFVAALIAIWRSGYIAMPMSPKHSPREWAHMIDDCGAMAVITNKTFAGKLSSITGGRDCKRLDVDKLEQYPYSNLPSVRMENDALMIYTSGTTSRPKGVVHSHNSVTAQMKMLVDAWKWSKADRTIDCLPLHHVHGLVNVLLCGLWAGAEIEMAEHFSVEKIWSTISEKKLSLFMAVPTIYTRLAQHWEKAEAKERTAFSKAARKMRLFVSGSSALPIPIFKSWEEITSHRILERYGMSEIGMALSNPYSGERRPGTVGKPLPGVEVRIVSEEEDDEGGELWVKSPAMFREYWQKPEATEKSFEDGWFKTGDVVAEKGGYYKILGRTSVDIIKSGGFKISALEVESVLLAHKSIEEVAVVGVDDPVWGERVGAAIVEAGNADITPGWLKGWAGEFLAPYKLPTVLVKLNSLPRNAMGKVDKAEIKDLISRELELERS